ncbi:MAG: DUF6125 family protein [Planctomycetota bacterium]|nr:DUF6125 family protein [Planctomycetota bacterium]
MRKESPKDLSREEMLKYVEDLCKRWLAHDGFWFLEVEKEYGLRTAVELDREVWEKFTVVEAQRIMKFLGLEEGCGLDGLSLALKFRLYANINEQTVERPDKNTLVFTMNTCRVQEARKRKGLADFPCKSVGLVEYTKFAETLDKRIKTECLFCPPDEHPEGSFCRWRFFIE